MEVLVIFLLCILGLLCVLGVLAHFVYVRTISNIKGDKELNIKTRGLRKWDKSGLYNRTESTPYLSLDMLTNRYPVSTEDSFVDFGSGKGRVVSYIFNSWNIPVTGIELDLQAHQEALENRDSFFAKHHELESAKEDFQLEVVHAEQYKIKDRENIFFFFNPFHVRIFEQVLDNIIKNSKELEKEVFIILYCPTDEYLACMENSPFKFRDEFKAKNSFLDIEKFRIYALSGMRKK